MRIITALKVLLLAAAIATMMSCGTKPAIIITGPMGIKANDDSYKTTRIKNVGSAYWRFWLRNDQQIVLYPSRTLFVKPSGDFWNRCQGFWVHAYLEVNPDGRVKESTFAGEQWVETCITGRKWVCDTGEVIGADVILGNAPQSYRSFPTRFSYSVPLLPIGIQGAIQ